MLTFFLKRVCFILVFEYFWKYFSWGCVVNSHICFLLHCCELRWWNFLLLCLQTWCSSKSLIFKFKFFNYGLKQENLDRGSLIICCRILPFSLFTSSHWFGLLFTCFSFQRSYKLRCMFFHAGLLHREHTFSRALSWPSHSEGPSHSTKDLSSCHTAGRSSCWVRSTSVSLSKLSKPLNPEKYNYSFNVFYTSIPLCPDLGDAAQWMETSVTSGEPPAAILGTNVATNTFLNRKAKTGSPGSLEVSFLSASVLCRELGRTDWAKGAGIQRTRFSWLKKMYCSWTVRWNGLRISFQAPRLGCLLICNKGLGEWGFYFSQRKNWVILFNNTTVPADGQQTHLAFALFGIKISFPFMHIVTYSRFKGYNLTSQAHNIGGSETDFAHLKNTRLFCVKKRWKDSVWICHAKVHQWWSWGPFIEIPSQSCVPHFTLQILSPALFKPCF